MHKMLVISATKAIGNVHSDTSVSLETTLGSLESLRDEIELLIEAVKEDIRYQNK